MKNAFALCEFGRACARIDQIASCFPDPEEIAAILKFNLVEQSKESPEALGLFSLKTYVLRAAGVLANRLARQSLRQRSDDQVERIDFHQPETDQEVSEFWDLVLSAVPDRFREVFSRHFRQGYSIAEIAAELSLSRQCVHAKIRTAIEAVASRLSRETLVDALPMVSGGAA